MMDVVAMRAFQHVREPLLRLETSVGVFEALKGVVGALDVVYRALE